MITISKMILYVDNRYHTFLFEVNYFGINEFVMFKYCEVRHLSNYWNLWNYIDKPGILKIMQCNMYL